MTESAATSPDDLPEDVRGDVTPVWQRDGVPLLEALGEVGRDDLMAVLDRVVAGPLPARLPLIKWSDEVDELWDEDDDADVRSPGLAVLYLIAFGVSGAALEKLSPELDAWLRRARRRYAQRIEVAMRAQRGDDKDWKYLTVNRRERAGTGDKPTVIAVMAIDRRDGAGLDLEMSGMSAWRFIAGAVGDLSEIPDDALVDNLDDDFLATLEERVANLRRRVAALKAAKDAGAPAHTPIINPAPSQPGSTVS